MFGFTFIKTADLETLKQEKDVYFKTAEELKTDNERLVKLISELSEFSLSNKPVIEEQGVVRTDNQVQDSMYWELAHKLRTAYDIFNRKIKSENITDVKEIMSAIYKTVEDIFISYRRDKGF